MRSPQNTTHSDEDLDDISSLSECEINDSAHDAAATGNIARAEKIRTKYSSTLHSIGVGIYAFNKQSPYLEKIQILTLLQHTTHSSINERIKWIRENERDKWFMSQATDQTVIKAHNALSLKRALLPITTDEACNLVHTGNWAALILMANLACGHIYNAKDPDKSDFLPFMVWIRILEFTLGINNRHLVKPKTLEETWKYTLMTHLGNFFSNVMRPNKQTVDNEATPHLPFRRKRK